MMMSFCKKSVHSFLSFTDSSSSSSRQCRNIPSPSAAGLTLFTLSNNNAQRPTNVLESASLNKPPPSSSTNRITTAAAAVTKRDPGGIGFLDDVGGSVDGLMSCTESLGFESSDERRPADDKIDNMLNQGEVCCTNTSIQKKKRNKKTAVKREKNSFPPPLSSFNYMGKPDFFLRPVRKEGRLELTQVKIYRPEIFRASRKDGRLRLNFIRNHEADIDEEEEHVDNDEEEIQEGDEEIEEMKEENKGGEFMDDEGWRFQTTNSCSGGGDGFRRCHKLVASHHHRHDLHVLRPHCVTTR